MVHFGRHPTGRTLLLWWPTSETVTRRSRRIINFFFILSLPFTVYVCLLPLSTVTLDVTAEPYLANTVRPRSPIVKQFANKSNARFCLKRKENNEKHVFRNTPESGFVRYCYRSQHAFTSNKIRTIHGYFEIFSSRSGYLNIFIWIFYFFMFI